MKDRISVKIINLARRADRREECRKEMAAIGWGEDDYAFFTARDMPGAGARGCSLSHGKVIADFLFAEEKPFLLVLEDDRHYFPPYDAVVVANEAALAAMPGLEASLRGLSGRIDAATMRRLNLAVDGKLGTFGHQHGAERP